MAPVGVRMVAGPAPVPTFQPSPQNTVRSTLVKSYGVGSAAGSATTLVAVPNGAAVGDMVLISFAWAVASGTLNTVTDSSGNTWTVVSTPAPGSESGGYAWTIVTVAWTTGTNNVTATLSTTGGGRGWAAVGIPALYSPVHDASSTPGSITAITGSITTPTLAQANEVHIFPIIARGATAGVTPSYIYSTNWQQVVFSTTPTAASVTLIGSYDNIENTTAPITASFQASDAGNQGFNIESFKVTYPPSGGTTFPITIIVSTVSLTATVIRNGLLNILPTVSTPVTLQRLGKLNISASVSAAASVVRKALLNIVTSTVTTPVTATFQKVILLTITVGTVGVNVASVVRKGLLNIVPTVSTPVTLQRLGKLIIKPTVAPTATDARKGLLNVTTGTVSTPATVARKGLLSIVTGTLTLPVTLIRKGLLTIKPTVTATATDTLVVQAASSFGVVYMNLTVIGESSNSTTISTVG